MTLEQIFKPFDEYTVVSITVDIGRGRNFFFDGVINDVPKNYYEAYVKKYTLSVDAWGRPVLEIQLVFPSCETCTEWEWLDDHGFGCACMRTIVPLDATKCEHYYCRR